METCRQGDKEKPRWEWERHQHTGQPWPRGFHQPCALRCTLQLPLATTQGSLCSLQFACRCPRTETAPAVPAERSPLTVLPWSLASQHSPGPHGWERGPPDLPLPPHFCFSQLQSWQAGLWPQDQCQCLAGGCWLCPMMGWGTGWHPFFAGGHPRAMHTSCTCSGPCCSCSACLALALTLHPATSPPARPQVPTHTPLCHLTPDSSVLLRQAPQPLLAPPLRQQGASVAG